MGEPYSETVRRQSFEETVEQEWLKVNTKYPLRLLGYGKKAVYITEEERPHIHLIGSTQEGKSKLIEHLIRDDIERRIGVCLLDPTTGGKTSYDVLRYCAHKGLNKVCLIDPYHRFQYNRIPVINPFLYASDGDSEKLKETSIKDVLDSVRVLFSTKDPADTGRVERYLPALLTALYDAGSPLYDARYFTNRAYEAERAAILARTERQYRLDLEEAFRLPLAYNNFQSTINRVSRFYKGTMGLMFAPATSIDFMKLVSEGWVILVNLDTGMGFDTLDSRLLGTLVINLIQTSIERLNKNGWHKPYYLYIDEASEYANRKLARTLSLKQKTGLRVTLGHQYTKQFEDEFVLNSVLANTKITAMFNAAMQRDRKLMSEQLGYGGEITPEMATDANANLPKQYAVMKVLKGNPQRVRIPTVEPPPVTDDELEQYILKLYEQPWYHDAKALKEKLELEENENEPLRTERTDPKAARPRTKAHSRTSRKARVPNDGDGNDKWKDVS
jgi:hypothetical protein